MKKCAIFRASAVLTTVILGGLRSAEQPSLGQQGQVVQMLRSGPKGLELAVQTLRHSPDARLREVAAYIIGEYGKQKLAGVLAESLTDSSEQVRRSVITALQKIVNPKVRGEDPKKVFAGMDVPVLPSPESLPPNSSQLCSSLQPLLKDRSPLVRAPAAETIGWLRCNSSLADLQDLMRDPVEPVRFRASHALELLTGKSASFINLDAAVWGPPPLAAVIEARTGKEAQQVGPFVRTAFFEGQGKFSFRGGIPAQFQTVTRIWRTAKELEFEAECQDERPSSEGDDRLTFFVKPQGQSKLYRFEIAPARGLVSQSTANAEGREEETKFNAAAAVQRNDHEWKAHLRIPFEVFGLRDAPVGEIWEANVVRVESHRATWGSETSSWAYYDRSSPGPPRPGNLYFAKEAPVLGFRPPPDNVYAFPFDASSFPGDLNRPIRPAADTLWGDIITPDHVVRGVNGFFISQMLRRPGQPPLQLSVAASDYEGRKVISSQVLRLQEPSQGTSQRVEIKLPEAIQSRAVDLDIVISGEDAQNELFRTSFICVPVVSPPQAVTSYQLARVKDEKGLWEGQERRLWRMGDSRLWTNADERVLPHGPARESARKSLWRHLSWRPAVRFRHRHWRP